MNWILRTNNQKYAEKKWEELCQKRDISLARSGIEQLSQDPKFKERLDKLEDETSKRLRFFPDYIVLDKEGWLVDVKNSKTIEKTAYDVYTDLSMIGYNVALVILVDDNKFLFINIEDLKIKEQKNNPYTENDKEYYSVGNPPVFDNKWNAPRGNPEGNWTKNWTEEDYYKWKEKTKGSGTTFGRIDFGDTKFITL